MAERLSSQSPCGFSGVLSPPLAADGEKGHPTSLVVSPAQAQQRHTVTSGLSLRVSACVCALACVCVCLNQLIILFSHCTPFELVV